MEENGVNIMKENEVVLIIGPIPMKLHKQILKELNSQNIKNENRNKKN